MKEKHERKKKRKCQKRKRKAEKLKMTQGERETRDRGCEGSGGRDKIKNGCLFIHNFLFIQIVRGPSGQPRSPCYVSERGGGATGGEIR